MDMGFKLNINLSQAISVVEGSRIQESAPHYDLYNGRIERR